MPVRKAAAFRAVFGYLSVVNPRITKTALKQVFEGEPDKANLVTRAVRDNASVGDAEEWLPVAVEALSQLIDEVGLEVPDAVAPLWGGLCEGYPDVLQQRELIEFPLFLDERGLDYLYQKQTLPLQPKNFVPRYAGCWRVFRLSSADGEEPRVSRSFLNIKPLPVLDTLGRRVPEFSLYSQDARNAASYFTIRGSLYVAEDLVTLIGARVNRHIPALLMWRWSADTARDRRETRIPKGLMQTINSSGEPIVAGFLAEYIEGSVDARAQAYEAIRDAEREAVGSFPLDDLSDLLTDADVAALKDMQAGDGQAFGL